MRREYQNLEDALRQRDKEWKSELETREKELSKELRAREKAFLSDQLRMDSEILKIMKEREDKTCGKRQMPTVTCIKNIRRK